MKTYSFRFRGCEKGAIGTQNNTFHKTVEADNLKEANLMLYDTHDHISFIGGQITITEDNKVLEMLRGWEEIKGYLI